MLSYDEFLEQLDRAGVAVAGENGHREAFCPKCGPGTLTITRREDGGVDFPCTEGCTRNEIGYELHWKENPAERAAEIDKATRELNELLELPESKAVIGARILGDGGEAAIYIDLADNSEIYLTAQNMARPAALLTALAIGPGVRPKLNQARALDAVVLVKSLARHVRTMSEVDQAIEWGVDFLQMAQVLDLDLYDQGERWGGFSHLNDLDPRARHRENNISIATASTVLRHHDGSRLVRSDWLAAYVRSIEPRVTRTHLTNLMGRVGWQRRGKEGRWKATPPGRPGQLNWSFYLVPPNWETRGEGVAVTAGSVYPPAHARTRVEAVTSRNQATPVGERER